MSNALRININLHTISTKMAFNLPGAKKQIKYTLDGGDLYGSNEQNFLHSTGNKRQPPVNVTFQMQTRNTTGQSNPNQSMNSWNVSSRFS
jgi:hypothetical protein